MKTTVGSWIAGHAERRPEDTALVDAETGQSWNYGEFNERTDRLADALRQAGVIAGDRVALVTLNSTAMLEIIVAISKLGAVSVPINVRLTPGEIRFILEDSGAVFCFASDVVMPAAVPAAEGLGIKQIVSVPTKISGQPHEASSYSAFLASGKAGCGYSRAQLEDLAMLMYTSGTTGSPKGAMLTNGNLLFNAIQTAEGPIGSTMNDINLSVAPLFHIGALGISTMPLLYWGGCNIVAETFDPDAWAEYVEEYRASKSFMVPTMWNSVVNSGSLNRHDTSSLQVGISGGAPCPVALLETLMAEGIPILEGFGMTETSPCVSMNTPQSAIEKAGSIGRPLMHVELRIVDSARNEVPVGEVGELALAGPSIISAYWNRPDANELSFEDGWFFSGDMTRVDEDGYYYIVDRKKDMVITGGENVFPAEVEQTLYRHEAVNEAAVVGTAEEEWGEVVTAFVVVSPGFEPAEQLADDIRDFSRRTLAGFKIPRRIHFVDELPKTATGKIRKTELRARTS